MSRKSLEAIRTATVEKVERLRPPDHLTEDEKAEWIAMVNSMPADYFIRGNQGLLEQYCHHMIAAREVAAEISAVRRLPVGSIICGGEPEADETEEEVPAPIYRVKPLLRERYLLTLLSKQCAETASINNLLRAMRLSQHSVYHAKNAATINRKAAKGGVDKPWEDAA